MMRMMEDGCRPPSTPLYSVMRTPCWNAPASALEEMDGGPGTVCVRFTVAASLLSAPSCAYGDPFKGRLESEHPRSSSESFVDARCWVRHQQCVVDDTNMKAAHCPPAGS